MIITFDGQSGTGKSTLAQLVSKKLGFKYLNSGMIYRAITYYFISHDVSSTEIEKIKTHLDKINIELFFVNDEQHVYIDKIDYTPFVSTQVVQQNVSLFSQVLIIREKITNIQHEYASTNNIVVEGRDVGSHVFPNADYKFFVKCDINVRANRRLFDLERLGQKISLQDVIKSLENRDYLDSTRKFSPLVCPENAIIIDTSNATIEQSVDQILSFIKKV